MLHHINSFYLTALQSVFIQSIITKSMEQKSLLEVAIHSSVHKSQLQAISHSYCAETNHLSWNPKVHLCIH